jgi:folate-binding protein YgfZ
MLDIAGAVEAEWPDQGVAAHYGDPMREQRAMWDGEVLVDRSNRGVVTVTGPDRLTWLHSLTSQQLERLPRGMAVPALILSPQGHIEHYLELVDDGDTVWLQVEPGTAPALVAFLNSMRFMLRVEVADVTAEYAVQTLAGPVSPAEFGRDRLLAAPPDAAGLTRAVTAGPFGIDLIIKRSDVGKIERTPAGMWAFEAVRIGYRVPRPGLDTDHKTLPHEVGMIGSAVHLNKGCYRGQETVARIHNIGHPPRRLVFLHLDGSVDRLPAHGTAITLPDGTQVGFIGSAARHFEMGPIALGLVKRTVPVDATLLADGIAAAQEVVVPPDTGANVRVTLRRDEVPQPPPAVRKLL